MSPHLPSTTLRPSQIWASARRVGVARPSRGSARNYARVAPAARPSPRTVGSPFDVAVIGGGITGLCAAYSACLYSGEQLRVMLYESSDRLGGWINTKHVDVGSGAAVFETGPRSLRPQGVSALYTSDLIQCLSIDKDVLTTPKTFPGARNRFVYYPDHLVPLPGPGRPFMRSISDLLFEPAFTGLFGALAGECFRPPRPPELLDESVGSFISRRFSPHMADNLVSAFVHGVYAGDLYKLSMRSLAPFFWRQETKHGSIVKGLLDTSATSMNVSRRDYNVLKHVREDGGFPFSAYRHASQLSFRHGIGWLTQNLERKLKSDDNCVVRTGSKVTSIQYDESTQAINVVSNNQRRAFRHVICTVPGKVFSSMVNPNIPQLAEIPSVSVMVVNLHYHDPNLLPVQGFGYLIPRSIPMKQNPERALGVVFDSDAIIGQDTASGTKVTVILGGHWWDEWPVYPDEEEAASMARAVLLRHLNITAEPTAIHVSLQRDCIPQYTVGHFDRLAAAHDYVSDRFHGRLTLAGSSYNGVSVNDCIRAGVDAAHGVKAPGPRKPTGLESALDESDWVTIPIPTAG